MSSLLNEGKSKDSCPRPPTYACPDDAALALKNLHSDFLLDALAGAWNRASEIDFQLRACKSFAVVANNVLEQLRTRSEKLEASRFWGQVSQLLILISRTSCRAIQRLVEGTAVAIGQKNELSLALMSRAMIEHCGALVWLRTHVLATNQHRLIDEIWPAIAGAGPLPSPIESDRIFHAELLRFALGARASADGIDTPDDEDGRTTWEAYRKRIEELPEEIRAQQVMNYVDELVKHRGYRDFRVNHAILSEYCHPNSSSRTLDFVAVSEREVSRQLTSVEGTDFSPGFVDVFTILRKSASRLCDRFEKDLQVMYATCIPMSAEEAMESVPPPGWIHCADLFTCRVAWIDPTKIELPENPLAELTATQERRATTVAQALASPQDISEQEWIRRLRLNANVESELRISEHMAHVFREETKDRPGASPSELSLVYQAIERSLFCTSTDELVSVLPPLKSLRNADRLFSRLKQRMAQ